MPPDAGPVRRILATNVRGVDAKALVAFAQAPEPATAGICNAAPLLHPIACKAFAVTPPALWKPVMDLESRDLQRRHPGSDTVKGVRQVCLQEAIEVRL